MEERVIDSFFSRIGTLFSVAVLRRAALGAGGKEALFQEYSGDTLDFTGISADEAQRALFDRWKDREALERSLEKEETAGIFYVGESEEAFPERLSDIPDRPFGLFYRGRLPDPGRPAVSIVGSRRASSYGREMALFFGEKLSTAGVNVISGMAFGIDGFAGRGALARAGASFAVLAGGVETCYPRENLDLYEALVKQGGIISERPPGYTVQRFDFPLRNRLVSGLSDALLVIEAAENSGSLITVQAALSQDRTVFALPGRVTDRMSRGTNRLLREGAEVLTCPEDVLQFLGVSVREDTVRNAKKTVSKAEAEILSILGSEALSTDTLMEKTGFPVPLLLENLLSLEIKGLAKKEAGGEYRAISTGKC